MQGHRISLLLDPYVHGPYTDVFGPWSNGREEQDRFYKDTVKKCYVVPLSIHEVKVLHEIFVHA